MEYFAHSCRGKQEHKPGWLFILVYNILHMSLTLWRKESYPISKENSFPLGTNSWKTRYLWTRLAGNKKLHYIISKYSD